MNFLSVVWWNILLIFFLSVITTVTCVVTLSFFDPTLTPYLLEIDVSIIFPNQGSIYHLKKSAFDLVYPDQISMGGKFWEIRLVVQGHCEKLKKKIKTPIYLFIIYLFIFEYLCEFWIPKGCVK